MALVGDEGRDRLRKASGSRLIGFDPGISEWGNPSIRTLERELTQGTEIPYYLEEEKSYEIPLVVQAKRE